MARVRHEPDTRTIRLGTGINILPQANPLLLAKQVASLDFLSRGRFLLGLGVWWVTGRLKWTATSRGLFYGLHLLTGFTTNHTLKIADHGRVGMRP